MSKEKFDPLTQKQVTDKLKADLKQAKQDKKELGEAKEAGYSSVETYKVVESLIKRIKKDKKHVKTDEEFMAKTTFKRSKVLREKIDKEVEEAIEELRFVFSNIANTEDHSQDSDPEDAKELSFKLRKGKYEANYAAKKGYPSIKAFRAIRGVEKIFRTTEDKNRAPARLSRGSSFRKREEFMAYLDNWKKELGIEE